jgi:hypothetical protein
MDLTVFRHHEAPVGSCFQDYGSAFVDALERRTSPFGILEIGQHQLSIENIKRLIQLDVFDNLIIGAVGGEHALLPFSAKANTLSYTIHAQHVRPEQFQTLDIVAKDLCVSFLLKKSEDWVGMLISFLTRVAELGHLEKFYFSCSFGRVNTELPSTQELSRVTDAIIYAVNNNQRLATLNSSSFSWLMKSAPELEKICLALEDHPGLRAFIVDETLVKKKHFYFLLERLLSRNRNIRVLGYSDKVITNGSTINKLNALNRFYNGSAALVKDMASTRPLFVTAALIESASRNLQYTALLLSDHTDILCELIHEIDFGTADTATAVSLVFEEMPSPLSSSPGSDPKTASKRSMAQPSHSAKKAARTNEPTLEN